MKSSMYLPPSSDTESMRRSTLPKPDETNVPSYSTIDTTADVSEGFCYKKIYAKCLLFKPQSSSKNTAFISTSR